MKNKGYLKVLLNAAVIVLGLCILGACQYFPKNNQGKIIARVHDKNLYANDLDYIVPRGLPPEDSAEIAGDFINKWVRKQLMLNLAEMSLTDEEKELEKQIDEYRASLLIFKYQQNYLTNRLDTAVADTQIVQYYTENTPNFILDNHIVKGVYLRIPRNAPETYKVRQWYRSENPEDWEKLITYCDENNAHIDDFRDQWLVFEKVMQVWPGNINNAEYFLKYRGYAESRDTTHYYFLNIVDYKLSSSYAPIDYVQEDIRNIIINKRKIQLIKKLEANVYNDALNHNNFNIY